MICACRNAIPDRTFGQVHRITARIPCLAAAERPVESVEPLYLRPLMLTAIVMQTLAENRIQ